MRMLTEHGELFGEKAVALEQSVEALARGDAPLGPVVERMRAATQDIQVEDARLVDDRVAHRAQLVKQWRMARVDRGVQLDHALGNFGLHRPGQAAPFQTLDQIGRIARKVEIA